MRLSFFFLASYISNALASLNWHHSRSGYSEITQVGNGLLWTTNFTSISRTSLPIIPLDLSFGNYNPCDESTHSLDNMKLLVLEYGVGNNSTDDVVAKTSSTSAGQMFIGLLRVQVILNLCSEVPFSFSYLTYAALQAQQMGAAGLIYVRTYNNGILYLFLPPQVDVAMKTVNGVAIVIPTVTLRDDAPGMLDIQRHMSGSLLGQKGWTASLIGGMQTDDPWANLYSRSLHGEPPKAFTAYRWFLYLIGVCGLWQSVVCLNGFLDEIARCCVRISAFGVANNRTPARASPRRTSRAKNYLEVSKRLTIYKIVVLLSELVIGGLQFAYWLGSEVTDFIRHIDPFGICFKYDYFVSRQLGELLANISTFSAVAMTIYCYESYLELKRIRAPQQEQGRERRLMQVVDAALAFSFFAVVIDQLAARLALRGLIGDDLTSISSFIQFVIGFISTAFLGRMGRLVDQELRGARHSVVEVIRLQSVRFNAASTAAPGSEGLSDDHSASIRSSDRNLLARIETIPEAPRSMTFNVRRVAVSPVGAETFDHPHRLRRRPTRAPSEVSEAPILAAGHVPIRSEEARGHSGANTSLLSEKAQLAHTLISRAEVNQRYLFLCIFGRFLLLVVSLLLACGVQKRDPTTHAIIYSIVAFIMSVCSFAQVYAVID